ncbi:MAG: GumC family protein [Nitrospiria bacterium]
MRKRRGIIAFAILLVLAFTLLLTQFLNPEPLYEATANVKYDRSSTLTGLYMDIITYTPTDAMATQTVVIRSYPIMEKVAKKLGLIPPDIGTVMMGDVPQDPSTFGKASVAKGDELAAFRKEGVESLAPKRPKKSMRYLQTIFDLQERVTTKQEGSTNIIQILARASDPGEAARIANTVAQIYREENIAMRNREVRAAQKFIESQIQVLGKRLSQAEQELRSYKEREQLVFITDEAKLLLNLLTNLEAEHTTVKRVLDETRAQLSVLRAQSSLPTKPFERIYTEESAALIFSLNTTLLTLLQERETLLIDYTHDHPKVQELDKKILNVKSEMIRELTSKIKIYQDREDVLHRQVEQHKKDYMKVPTTALEVARLEREVKVNEETYALLKSKHEEAMIKGAEQIEEVTLIAPAFPPAKPVNAPKTAMNVTVGGLIGLLMGVFAAFTREALDTSLGTIEDTEEFLGVSVLGVIPTINAEEVKEVVEKEQKKEDRRKQDPTTYGGVERRVGVRRHLAKPEVYLRLISLLAPQSITAEAYRTVRTGIGYATLGRRDFKTLLFCSASLSEGKTTSAINIAITMAQIGKRVLLIDADLRQPTIHEVFGLQKDPGLTEILMGSRSWQEAIRTVSDLLVGPLGVDEIIGSPGIDKISIITSGSIPLHPAECIDSPKMEGFLKEVREHFDLVVVDTPPILPVADAVILGSKVDGVVLIYQAGRVPRIVLKRAKQLMDKGQANVLGVVLNNVSAQINPDYVHRAYYHYAYPSRSESKEAVPTKPSRWKFLTHLFNSAKNLSS